MNRLVTRHQMPLRIAKAKTVFTCQGKTLQKAAVDLHGTRLHGAHYTALSRVTKLDDLYVLDLCPEKLHVNNEVRQEMDRLRSVARLQLCVQPLQKEKAAGPFIISHNARHGAAHAADIQADPDFCAADVIHLTETHDSHASISLPGYTALHATSTDDRQHGSTLLYSSSIVLTSEPTSIIQPEYEIVSISFAFDTAQYTFIGVYREIGRAHV